MQKNVFEQLPFLVDGAPETFETLATELLRVASPEVNRVRVARGDGGVDAFLGEWGTAGSLHVFQVKYFVETLNSSRRAQIRESFETARDNPRFVLTRWTLCLPVRLGQNDRQWFDEWRREQAVPIDLIDGDAFVEILARPGAAPVRERLREMKAIGLMDGGPLLRPSLQFVTQQLPSNFALVVRLTLTNGGDRTVRNIRLVVRHSETGCLSWKAPADHWQHEKVGINLPVNPRTLSAKHPINPGETFPIFDIPFSHLPNGSISVIIDVSAEDSQPRRWTFEGLIGEHGVIVELTDGPTVKAAPRPMFEEPKHPLAQELLRQIKANDDPATMGLSIILKDFQAGTKAAYPSTGPHSRNVTVWPEADLEAAVAELVRLGWLADGDFQGVRRVYRFPIGGKV